MRGRIEGQGYDEATGRVWCTLFAIADWKDSFDEQALVLNVPQDNKYEYHFANVTSKNEEYGYDIRYEARRLFCRVWARYAYIGARRSWVRTTFYLDTRETSINSQDEEKEFLARVDPDRAARILELEGTRNEIPEAGRSTPVTT
jgi:hypothetical protein